jgi:hypothetical protein
MGHVLGHACVDTGRIDDGQIHACIDSGQINDGQMDGVDPPSIGIIAAVT